MFGQQLDGNGSQRGYSSLPFNQTTIYSYFFLKNKCLLCPMSKKLTRSISSWYKLENTKTAGAVGIVPQRKAYVDSEEVSDSFAPVLSELTNSLITTGRIILENKHFRQLNKIKGVKCVGLLVSNDLKILNENNLKIFFYL